MNEYLLHGLSESILRIFFHSEIFKGDQDADRHLYKIVIPLCAL